MPRRSTAFMSTVASSCIASTVVLAVALLLPASARAQTPDLKYFTNFTLTGDYVVAGVDLQSQSQWNWFCHRHDPGQWCARQR